MIFSHLMEQKNQKKSCGWHTIYTLLSHYSPHLCFYILFNFFLFSLFLLPLSCMLLSCIRFSKNPWNQYARNININCCCCCWLPDWLAGSGWLKPFSYTYTQPYPCQTQFHPISFSRFMITVQFFFGVRCCCCNIAVVNMRYYSVTTKMYIRTSFIHIW